jgi:heme A synthase
MRGQSLHRFSLAVAALTWMAVLQGALQVSGANAHRLVEATSLWAAGHRHLSLLVGLLDIGQAVLMLWNDGRRWLAALGWTAVAVTGVQVISGLSLTGRIPPPVLAVVHAVLGQLLIALTSVVAIATSAKWRNGRTPVPDAGFPPLRTMGWVMPVTLVIQVGLGAAYRHQAASMMPHVIWAFAAIVVVLMTSVFVMTQQGTNQSMRWWAIVLMSLLGVQVVLGVGASVGQVSEAEGLMSAAWMSFLTVTHVATGALVMGASSVLSALIFYHVETASAAAAHSGNLSGSGHHG